MTARGFFILTAIAAALIVAAIFLQPATTTSNPTPGPRFFPTIDANTVNTADRVVVKAKGETITIERRGDDWVVKEKGGYPAKFERVKEALVSIAQLRRFERKTKNPERLHHLDLEDPDKKGASSKRLTVSAKGKTIADVIVGKSNDKDILFGRSLVYVRMPKSDQAWLAIGDPKLASDPVGWIDKALVDVDTARVKHVDQTGAKGAKIIVGKDKPDAKQFALLNKPEGRELKSKRFPRYIAEGLDNLSLEDVRPASEIDFKKNGVGSNVFRTFDGLAVTVRLAEVGEKKDKQTWVTISARYDPSAALKDKPKKSSKLKAADAVKKEAAEINKKVKGWAFRLPSTATRFMHYDMEEMLKPAPKKKEQTKPAPEPSKSDAPKPDAPKKGEDAK